VDEADRRSRISAEYSAQNKFRIERDSMKVVYAGRDSKKQKALLAQHPDVIVLLLDNWDDFNFKTTFPTDCRMNGSDVEIDR
jgi:hypothetical protein